MKFSKTFTRSLPAGVNPALGSDVAPTLVTDVGLTNGSYLRFAHDDTEISHSLAVVVTAPGGSDPIPLDLYFWDELTTRWYIADIEPVTPNVVTRMDVSMLQPQPVAPTFPQLGADLATGAYVIVPRMTLGGAYPNGDYVFAFGMDAQDAMTDLDGAIAILVAATHLEDTPHVTGDRGVFALAVRNDAATTVLTSLNGDYSGIAVDDRGQVFVRISSGQDKTATGTIPAAGGGATSVAIDTQQSGSCAIKIGGTAWTGRVEFEGLVFGSPTWDAVVGVVQGTGVGTTFAVADGLWIVDCAAFSQIRVRGNVVATGTATVFMEAAIPEQGEVAQGPAGDDPWPVLMSPTPADAWTPLRTFAGTVADVASPAVIQVVTGIVDMNAFVYPGALPGLTVIVNGVTCTFGVGAPANLPALLVALNTAMPDMTWTAPGAAFVLIGTKNTPGNIALSGTALATLGLAAGTTGAWVEVPTALPWMGPAPMVEVGFIPLPTPFAVANAPNEVILRLWRLSSDVAGVAEIAGEMRIPATEINSQHARRFSFDGTHAFLSLAFVGGAAPTLTGVVDIRAVSDGDQPIASQTLHAYGPSILAMDVSDNAPTQAIYNYSTARLDGTAVRLADNTITFTITPPLTAPTSGQLCRVRVLTTPTAAPLVWEQGRNAVLTIAAGIITVNALDGTVITVPAAATAIEVMWAGPDKGIVQEDAAAVSGEFLVKGGRVRRDVAVSSAGSDGDWATPNQDADGYDYVRDKAYDSASNANREFEVAPVWGRNVATPVTIATALTLTNAWQDLGPEIPLQGYTKLGLWINLDINDSVNLRVRCQLKNISAGTYEYNNILAMIDEGSLPANVKVQPQGVELDVDTDLLFVLPWVLDNFVPFVQFQVMVETAGVTPGVILNSEVTYGFGG